MKDEYVIEPSSLKRRFFEEEEGEEESIKVYLDGLDGGPDAVVVRHSDDAKGSRHFHHGSQFQFSTAGVMEFHDLRLEAPAVFYTDHNTAYGPFKMLDEHRMLVIHPRPAGQVFLDRKGPSAELNRDGRKISGTVTAASWEAVPDSPGTKSKTLISPQQGPTVQLVQCQPGASLATHQTAYGRFEFIMDGTAELEGRPLERETLRFIRGTRPFSPLVAGPDGATIAVLCFDEDAEKGELGGISIADRMAEFSEVDASEVQYLKSTE
jgi:hypothetical protein